MIFIYLLVILYSLFIGFHFFRKNYNSSGFFFFIFMVSLSIWFCFYFLSYFSTEYINIMYIYSKITYSVSIVGIYSFLLFVLYYGDKNNEKILVYKNYLALLYFLFILILYNFSSYIIDGMLYNDLKNHYYESPGILYSLHIFFSFSSLILLLIISYLKLKKLTLINKMRLKYILFGIFILFFLGFIFLLILPKFGFRVMEKEIIYFVIPYLLAISYSINKYNFTDLGIEIGRFFTFFCSILLSIIFIISLKKYYLHFGDRFNDFWGLSDNFGILDLILGIFIYTYSYKLFYKFFLGNNYIDKFEKSIFGLKKIIPYISSLDELNDFLLNNFNSIFKIKNVKIELFLKENKYSELFYYFKKDKARDLFINDLTFIEENKYKFNKSKLSKELKVNINLVLPLYDNKRELKGIFFLGRKPFSDNFSIKEINIIKEFRDFLIGHLKYLEIYEQINDLNLNLDKKVDEKTIEYNNLLNKQKEFISIASHEIKTPVMASSLQIESIVDDLEDGDISDKELKRELHILKNQIFKLSDLVKVMFSAQKYDINKISLYIEKIKLKDIILSEIETLQKKNDILIIDLIFDDNVKFIDLDKVQFTQVISNLLNNALKFVNKQSPFISITVKESGDYLYIDIEDNGKGFTHGEEELLFDKYSTGKGKSIGLGLGLYLCKKILEYHNGEIKAMNSKELGGAKFNLKIPKIQKKDI